LKSGCERKERGFASRRLGWKMGKRMKGGRGDGSWRGKEIKGRREESNRVRREFRRKRGMVGS